MPESLGKLGTGMALCWAFAAHAFYTPTAGPTTRRAKLSLRQ